MKKTTLHGVNSTATKEMFTELKKRGFAVSLEKGPNKTFKILAFINGVEFVLSCVDGESSKYTKGYSRNKWNWLVFECIDDLLLCSMVKKSSLPTEKQGAFFKKLTEQLSALAGKKVKIKIPVNVVEMSSAINEAIIAKQNLEFLPEYKIDGEYITLT